MSNSFENFESASLFNPNNPGERAANLNEVDFFFKRLLADIPILGKIDQTIDVAGVLGYVLEVTDRQLLNRSGLAADISRVTITVDDSTESPVDDDEYRATIEYNHDIQPGQAEILHTLEFNKPKRTGLFARLMAEDNTELHAERNYENPNSSSPLLLESTDIQAGELEQVGKLLTALEEQLSQNLFA